MHYQVHDAGHVIYGDDLQWTETEQSEPSFVKNVFKKAN